MLIKKLGLVNFRNHRKTELALFKGVTAITGPNGAGKSSIFEAVKYLLSNNLDSNKEEVITLGEVEGYVWMEFELAGKEGYLEKHLDVNKTILEYDGTSYKKVADVKKLWSSLMQIDPVIIDNVIIAQQGEIPLLYSGDQAIREKTFQKIFLVPDTNKLRTIIWDKYIKLAPSINAVNPDADYQVALDKIVTEVASLLEQTQAITLLPEQTVTDLQVEKQHLFKCQKDIEEVVKYNKSIEEKKQLIESWLKSVEVDGAVIAGISEAELRAEVDRLTKLKHNFDQKVKLEAEYQEVSKGKSVEEIQSYIVAITDKIDLYKASYDESLNKLAVFDSEINELRQRVNQFSKIGNSCNCPTCLQDIKEIKATLEIWKQSLEVKLKVSNDLLIESEPKKKLLDEAIKGKESLVKIVNKLADLMLNIKVINVGNYSLSALQLADDQFKTFIIDKDKYNNSIITLHGLKSELGQLEISKSKLSVYEGVINLNTRIEQVESELRNQSTLKNDLITLQQQLAIKKQESSTIAEQRKKNTELINRNAEIEVYTESLKKLYDTFHSTKFPRRLIESYTGDVEYYLSHYMAKFNIPYTAKVSSDFSIEILNEDGGKLPKVSGGQKMIVGLCLRLALHSLFSQSMDIFLLDEGSDGLDSENLQHYFNLVKELKTLNLNQILIIDHDDRLSEYVDNVIKL